MDKTILDEKEKLARELKKEVCSIFDALESIGIQKFNNNSKYFWKDCYDGYGGIGRIFVFVDEKKWWSRKKRYIVIDGISDYKNYYQFIDSGDHRILEIIEEATNWIITESKKIKLNIDSFNCSLEKHQEKILLREEAMKELEIYLKG